MNRLKVPVFIEVVLILAVLQLAGNINAATIPQRDISSFRKISSEIKPGMKKAEVVSILGKPAAIITPNDDMQLKKLNAKEGLVYWHPEYATVHLLVGINRDSVTGTAMCRDVGSRVHNTECSHVSDYWKEENE